VTTQALQAGPGRLRPGRLFMVGLLMTGGGLVVSVPMMLTGGSGSTHTEDSSTTPATAPAPESSGSQSTIIPIGEGVPSVIGSVADGLSADVEKLKASAAAQNAAAASKPAPAAASQSPAPAPAPSIPDLSSLLPPLAPVGPSAAGGSVPGVGDLLPIVTDTVGGLPIVSDLLGGGSSGSPQGGGLPLGGGLPVGGLLGGSLLGGGGGGSGDDLLGGGLISGDGDDQGSSVAGIPLPLDGLLGGLLG
jgi:hypothetical protein